MDDDSEKNLCNGCYTLKGIHACSACKKAFYCSKQCQDFYCSKQCQERDWCYHIFGCTGDKPIKTYHHLARAILKDLLPTDGPTKEAWGFNRAEAATEELPGAVYLFGVYVGLVNYHNVEPKTLDKWRREGVLLREIKRVYEAIPEAYRGQYYPWLLRHQYVLDTSQPLPTNQRVEALARNILQMGWAYAGDGRKLTDAQIQEVLGSWPKEKVSCFHQCAMALMHIRPEPALTMWLEFGYCVGDLYSEMAVANLYTSLLRVVSFQEFYRAYIGGRVAVLMKEKVGKGSLIGSVWEEFEDVMGSAGVNGMPKSVWLLKACVQAQAESTKPDDKIPRPVWWDYGFSNCKTEAEIRTLLQIYRRYFESDRPDARPLELHEACIRGKIFEHLSLFPMAKLKGEHRRLLKNTYPHSPPPDE